MYRYTSADPDVGGGWENIFAEEGASAHAWSAMSSTLRGTGSWATMVNMVGLP